MSGSLEKTYEETREKEKQIKHEVDAGLPFHREQTIENIAAHMRILRQRVRPSHEEQRPVHLDHHVEGRRRRRRASASKVAEGNQGAR